MQTKQFVFLGGKIHLRILRWAGGQNFVLWKGFYWEVRKGEHAFQTTGLSLTKAEFAANYQ